MSSALAPLAQALFESLYPLVQAAESPPLRRHLLRQLGWDESAAAELFVLGPEFVQWWQRGLEHQKALDKAIAAKDGEAQFAEGMLLLEIAFELTDALAARAGKPSAGPLKPAVLDALYRDLALALPEFLLLRWLRAQRPWLYWLLRVTDVVELETIDATQPARVAADVPRLRLERLGALIGEPEAYLQGRYDWGFDAAARNYRFRHDPSPNAPLRHGPLLRVLHHLFEDLGFQSALTQVRSRYIANGSGAPSGSALFARKNAALPAARQLALPLVRGRSGQGPWAELGLDIVPLPGERAGQPIDGLFITHRSTGGVARSIQLAEGWTLETSAAAEAAGALALRLLPGRTEFASAPPQGGLEFRLIGKPDAPWVLLGSNTGTRLELRGAEAGIAFSSVGGQSDVRLFFDAASAGEQLVLVLSPGEGDSFIRELLGDVELEATIDLGFAWSSVDGFRITGDTGLCVTLPLELPLGPLVIEQVHLCLEAGAEGLSLLATATARARLGPLVCSVDEVGVEVRLGWGSSAREGERFGGLGLNAGFKPPSGVGLGLESELVRAGGYLELDRERGEYGGTASVGIGPLALTAVGLLDVQRPEAPGWSLLLAICADFTPLPLGFGFSLNGVGGLIGIGRTISEAALQRRLSSGGLDAVMFPDDPIANGPAIVETLRELFPVAPGQVVFGPMLKIGWGAPTLLEADLGAFIELPNPVRIVLLGQIASELPTKELALLALHLDAAGVFDASALSLSLDAALYDSWLVGYCLSGGVAIRASFGEAPSFLFSLGGFHPAFEPPGPFPALKRATLGLAFDDDLKIEATSYLAFSANTIQFGAHVDVAARLKILTLEGGAGFDVLVNASPFSFLAEFDAYVRVALGSKELLGVAVSSSLSGPEPWFFRGTARFEVLYKEWPFDVAFKLGGKQKPLPLDAISVAALVRDALGEPGAWSQPSATGGANAASSGVLLAEATTLASPPAAGKQLPTLVLRPDRDVELRQRVAPLGVTLEKFGQHEVLGSRLVDIERVSFGSVAVAAEDMRDVDDWFAPAQFFELGKSERLAAPSFEPLSAGKRVSVGGVAVGASKDRALEHEFGLIDRDLDRARARAAKLRRGEGRQPAQAPAVAKGATKGLAQRRRAFACEAPAVRLKADAWQVIDVGGAWRSPVAATFAEARRLLNARRRELPQLKGRLRVVPAGDAKQSEGGSK
ncbi:MAG TPA: DUF6603 domain-containing protein [Polyangiaceae bacterium]|nr:DUF6603 domain-containing protein [Polyangiaceae bacterium]